MRAEGIDMQIAVNLSARSLHQLTLPTRSSTSSPGMACRPNLRLEVTGSALMADPETAMKVLADLHERGIGLSIDDFGTGYSSMSYLKFLPVDELKVDRSFVVDLLRSTEDAAIVRAAIDLGHHFGMTLVAEGVELPDARRALADMGCDSAQGYHFARPLPADELWPYLKAHTGAGVREPPSSADERASITPAATDTVVI